MGSKPLIFAPIVLLQLSYPDTFLCRFTKPPRTKHRDTCVTVNTDNHQNPAIASATADGARETRAVTGWNHLCLGRFGLGSSPDNFTNTSSRSALVLVHDQKRDDLWLQSRLVQLARCVSDLSPAQT
ncbi:hypothetical protein B0T10DRAFT_302151 [Thelonectria olida]|uniref:Uncharacterized protein n=1 Tax=Thelonectria olida TaxID=1576542 RepID=A0A9P8W6N1_9HYPO|nr:hypothetical protein B0T10DRAFT_302151 [Thelonectria olida]